MHAIVAAVSDKTWLRVHVIAAKRTVTVLYRKPCRSRRHLIEIGHIHAHLPPPIEYGPYAKGCILSCET
jgi:hypothetical protein